ncbi:trypsin-like peptidase domain-containing protein [Parvularcula lutaonensis]|uniref:Trypsin-like peptidase domain-containing protein n=1 Tax=Parvularcula lutaonensis TaxID=491923 RepID=A0ABV7M8I6_9PROT|nr:trypsin-like peptidase domain-containing protein [Parvularcula lutaonensis]GGY44887.1 serine protease [Parvularcula lutaonensis]
MARAVLFAFRFAAIVLVLVAPARAGAPDSFADLAERVLPSVVNVSTVPGGSSSGAEPRALGSGFVIESSGIIVTNNHVIENARNLVVIFGDDAPYDVKVRGRDVETDLAVLEIIDPDRRFPTVNFGNSENARVGDWVLAIGNPFGLGNSVSAGIISGQSRDIGAGLYDKFIQTDAAINRGNSGGPLFDRRGRVIGVNTVIFSQTGGNVGVGFAIPAEIVEPVVRQLVRDGRTTRGYLGAFLDDVDAQTQQQLGLDRGQGALVTGIAVADGPAAVAGLRTGDVILSFDGKPIEGRRELTRVIAAAPIGEPIPVVINRDGTRRRVDVVLVTRETRLAGLNQDEEDGVEMAGLRLQTVSNTLADRFDLPRGAKGVVVTGVSHHLQGTSSLQPGDVILEIGWDEAETAEGVGAKLRQLRDVRSGPVKILVQRGDRLFYETLRP